MVAVPPLQPVVPLGVAGGRHARTVGRELGQWHVRIGVRGKVPVSAPVQSAGTAPGRFAVFENARHVPGSIELAEPPPPAPPPVEVTEHPVIVDCAGVAVLA